MYRRQYSLLALLLAAACAPFRASGQDVLHVGEQVSPDTVLRMNTASIVFDHALDTYNWIGRTALDTSAGGLRIGLQEQYAANVIRLEAASPGTLSKLQSNQENIALTVRAPLSEVFSPQAQWTSLVYSDNKGTDLNSASSHALLGGFDYAPLPWLFVTPMAGYRWDTQAGIADRGGAYALGVRLLGVEADGYRVAGSAQYREDVLDPRRLEGHFARIGVQRSFSSYTRDSLEAGFSRNRMDFYSPADSNIESRIEQVLTFSNVLNYDLDPSITTTLSVGIYDRGLDKDIGNWNAVGPKDVQFNTHIDEFRLDTYVQAGYRSSDLRTGARLRFAHSERTENHSAIRPTDASPVIALQYSERNKQEQVSNNASRRTVLSGDLLIPLSLSDDISLSGSAGILHYDTPSELNVEDRDELLYVLTLATSHRISRMLEIGIELNGTLSHTVYLLKERSANNAINRVLRLAPRSVYRPVRAVTSINTLEVLANYTVYDFEQLQTSVKSYSYRQFGWLDSTSFDLTHSLGIDFYSYWRVYQRGQLNWSEFRERLENSATEQTYALQFRTVPLAGVQCAVGFRYFGQSRYNYTAGEKELDTFLSSSGPTCTLGWNPGPHSRLQFQGWIERRHQSDGSVRSYSDMNMTINLIL